MPLSSEVCRQLGMGWKSLVENPGKRERTRKDAVLGLLGGVLIGGALNRQRGDMIRACFGVVQPVIVLNLRVRLESIMLDLDPSRPKGAACRLKRSIVQGKIWLVKAIKWGRPS